MHFFRPIYISFLHTFQILKNKKGKMKSDLNEMESVKENGKFNEIKEKK